MQLWLPRTISRSLTEALDKELDYSEEISVKVRSFPSIKLSFGFVDRLEIRGEGVLIDDLPIRVIEGEFEGLRLKRVQEEWEVVRGENTYLNIEFFEDELNDYLRDKEELDIFDNLHINLLSNKVMMVGNIRLFNASVNLQIEGRFLVGEEESIIYKVDNLAVQNIVIPSALIEQLKDQLQFEIDLSDLPFPLKIRNVKMREDKIIIN